MVEAFKTRGYGGVSLTLSHTYLRAFKLKQISKAVAHRARQFSLHSDQLSVSDYCFKTKNSTYFIKVLIRSLFYLFQGFRKPYPTSSKNTVIPLPIPPRVYMGDSLKILAIKD